MVQEIREIRAYSITLPALLTDFHGTTNGRSAGFSRKSPVSIRLRDFPVASHPARQQNQPNPLPRLMPHPSPPDRRHHPQIRDFFPSFCL